MLRWAALMLRYCRSVAMSTKQGIACKAWLKKLIHLISPMSGKNVIALDDLLDDLGMSAKYGRKRLHRRCGSPHYGVGFAEFGDGMAVLGLMTRWVSNGGCVLKSLAKRAERQAIGICAATVQEDRAAAEPLPPMGCTLISRSRSMSRMLRIILASTRRSTASSPAVKVRYRGGLNINPGLSSIA